MEPIPEVFSQLDRQRQCHKIQGAVGAKSGTAKFRVATGYAAMLSGLEETFDPRHAARLTQEVREFGGEQRSIEVTVYTLQELLQRFGFSRVDYMTIDTEGAELSILESFDFSKFDIGVIGLENIFRDSRIPKLLSSHGYAFHSILGDEFYVKVK